MKNLDDIKTALISYKAIYCKFLPGTKILTFEENDGLNEILKGNFIFHPEFGVYKVMKDVYWDTNSRDSDDSNDNDNIGEIKLLKSVDDLLKENKYIIVTKNFGDPRAVDACAWNKYEVEVEFYFYDGKKYVEMDINTLLKTLLKKITEKDEIIAEKDKYIAEQKEILMAPGGKGYELLMQHFYGKGL